MRSGSYTSILVVVDALTRYTLYLPVREQTGEEVVRALVDGCFSLFGYPKVIVSDNGSSFRAGLLAEFSKLMGIRKIEVLPYQAMANGMAEAAVKRVKNLLNRHTVLMRNWHQSLSLLQFALNSVIHTSTGVSPYFALFGRDPVSMAEMEFPELEFTETTGDSFVADRAHTMKTIWEMVREASDDIKQKRAMQQNARSRVTAAWQPTVINLSELSDGVQQGVFEGTPARI